MSSLQVGEVVMVIASLVTAFLASWNVIKNKLLWRLTFPALLWLAANMILSSILIIEGFGYNIVPPIVHATIAQVLRLWIVFTLMGLSIMTWRDRE